MRTLQPKPQKEKEREREREIHGRRRKISPGVIF